MLPHVKALFLKTLTKPCSQKNVKNMPRPIHRPFFKIDLTGMFLGVLRKGVLVHFPLSTFNFHPLSVILHFHILSLSHCTFTFFHILSHSFTFTFFHFHIALSHSFTFTFCDTALSHSFNFQLSTFTLFL